MTPNENKILKIIETEGGESTVGKISAKMRMETNYIRIMLRSMGENNIIDLYRNGKVVIRRKGFRESGKEGKQIDGLKRYLDDLERGKTF